MRVIEIEKIQDITKVVIRESETTSKKSMHAYGSGGEIELNKDFITVRDLGNTHPLLVIRFEELADNLTATNIEEYFGKMIENNFFKS